jgi:hypothetical protein
MVSAYQINQTLKLKNLIENLVDAFPSQQIHGYSTITLSVISHVVTDSAMCR